MAQLDLDGKEITPRTICLIGGGGFIGSHLCELLMAHTHHSAIVIDVSSEKITHLLEKTCSWSNRIEFHKINIKNDSRLETLIKSSDLVKYCAESNKRLIHFSTCEVYGKTIGSFLPPDHILRQDPNFYILKEDLSPCIFGSVEKQRWSYACAKQMIERLIYAEGVEHGLKFTIIRPFNWIGPRMDFIPGIDGPTEGIPRVLACFSNNLLRGEPLKLVDGGKSQRTFCYIKDAIEAVLLMIENPERANGQIFNVGNPNNEVTMKQLAELMIEIYGKISVGSSNLTTVDVSSKDFYGVGYDDSDKRIPDMTIINKQLGWNPKTPLQDLLEVTLTYQQQTYSQSIKKVMSNPTC